MLPVMAAIMTRTDWGAPAKYNKLAIAVKSYLWKNPRMGCYTKRALIRRFREEWMPTLSEDEKREMVLDFRMFTAFDENGYAIIDTEHYNKVKDTFKSLNSELEFKVIHIPTLPKGTKLNLIDDEDFKVYTSENINGFWTVPTFISTAEWYGILQGVSEGVKILLSCFLQMPEHRASVLDIEKIFGVEWHSANAYNTALGRRAENYLGNFEVRDPEGKHRLWSVAMNRGRGEATGFVWELRPELAEAATRYLNEIGFKYKNKL